jgi:catechol 2,3-dioxygenase-like lactoylglutathione lyase family enzyme
MFLPKTHIHLGVEDANRSAAFYEALLGAPPTRRCSRTAMFELESPPLILTLERARTNPSHFFLLVTEPRHVADVAIALRRAGIRLRLEDEGVEVEDPNGNAWHVRLAPTSAGRSVRGPCLVKPSKVSRREEGRHR